MSKFNSFNTGFGFEIAVLESIGFRHNARLLADVSFYSHALGGMSKIDVVLVSRKGVFVIEAKNFKTSLKGRFDDNFWLGLSGKTSTKVFNTYMQNLLHVRLVQQFLRMMGIEGVPVYDVILVPDRCRVESDVKTAMTLGQFHDWYEEVPDFNWDYERAHKLLQLRSML